MKKTTLALLAGVLILFVWTMMTGQPVLETPPKAITEKNSKPEAAETFVSEPLNTEKTIEKEPVSWQGAMKGKVMEVLGKPTRVDPSGYGHEWWMYETAANSLFLLGMKNEQVVTALFFNEGSGISDYQVGDPYEEVVPSSGFEKQVSLKDGFYRFELTEKDTALRPLVSLRDGWYAQLYVDQITNKIYAIRILTDEVLLQVRPYQLVYRGKLPVQNPLDRNEWEQVEDGVEAQIFAMTNHVRHSFSKEELAWHTEASVIAFFHSKDMNDQNYFSHYDPEGNGLKERFSEVSYLVAGENIAAQYTDAAAAMHGWLNSEGHRKALLDPEFTHLGVGVHQKYYTQNFLALP